MQYIKVSITLPADYLKVLDAVAKTKGRQRSQQIRESLINDPDFYEVWESMKNELEAQR